MRFIFKLLSFSHRRIRCQPKPVKAEDLKPNKILRGPLFPEPVQVIIAVPMGS